MKKYFADTDLNAPTGAGIAMKKIFTIASITLLTATFVSGFARAQQAPASTLPVKNVTLFTSGVAYTERAGTVDGDAAIPLTFRTAQINDILKSLVLIDRGGKVQPATYGSRDPIGRSLQAFAVDVTQNSTRDSILGSLRGAHVSVSQTGKPTLEGQILGIERRDIPGVDGKPINVSCLNLLTDAGLISTTLDSDKVVKLLDERLNREFHDALTLLATGTDDQRRSVMLHFAGAGKRDVKVGYVMEAPIWKISYRLLVGGDGKGRVGSYMQGWALVENTTDEDWNNVSLALVSGRPVSFIQDLYQPLYVPRPVVGPDIVASPYPQTHDDALERDRAVNAPVAAAGAMGPSGPAGSSGADGAPGMRGGMGGFGGGGGGLPGHTAIQRRTSGGATFADTLLSDAELAKRSVEAQSAGEKAGELFQYQISTPVSLPRQQAAMIPVIAQDIETEKVSLYNADSGPRYPMNAIRLHNNTSLHLKGGPVTLFDEGVYAGDARMEDVQPGDSRLITYAVDLAVEGTRQVPNTTTTESSVSVKHGVLTLTRREVLETVYTMKSKADKPRTILIEQPIDPSYKLVTPAKPAEATANLYRFALTLAPGATESLKIVTERPANFTVVILDGDLNYLAYTAARKDIPVALKTALEEVIKRRQRIDTLKANAEARANEVTSIGNDQERIRKNMEALDKNSALYKRYVSELDQQESKIESLRQEAIKLRADAAAAQLELRSFIDNINL